VLFRRMEGARPRHGPQNRPSTPHHPTALGPLLNKDAGYQVPDGVVRTSSLIESYVTNIKRQRKALDEINKRGESMKREGWG